ncbi:MAG: GatB/YqeY domain-containing protein [Bacteroidales bacterium]|nr:GatB/YqeY domain-containing protein [Bacteroidales bacterium]
MSLEQKINEDIKAAMLAKEKERLNALRAIKSAILLLKTEKGGNEEISEAAEMALLQKLVKQRKESAELYKSQNREDLYNEEMSQYEVIVQYLPQQMSEDEIRAAVAKIIADNNISSIKEMGKAMGVASKQLAGKADNKKISEIVKALLS